MILHKPVNCLILLYICWWHLSLSTTLEIVIRNTQILTIDNILDTEIKNENYWLKLNKLSLNLKKCKYMIFHSHRKLVKPLHSMIDGTFIERVAEFNFIGLTLDENLSWINHINKISNMKSKSMGILNKLKLFKPIKTKILIYNSSIITSKFRDTCLGHSLCLTHKVAEKDY